MREACRSIVPPMVERDPQLIATFDPTSSRAEEPRAARRRRQPDGGLREMLERRCTSGSASGRSCTVDEPIYGGANGALKIAHDMPAEFWKSSADPAAPTGAPPPSVDEEPGGLRRDPLRPEALRSGA
jgi:rod shape-determining protein MreB